MNPRSVVALLILLATTMSVARPAATPDGTDGLWLEQELTFEGGQAYDNFARSVRVVGDSAFVSMPAVPFRPGKVCVFARSGETWTLVQTISATPSTPPPPGSSDFFGSSLAVSGDTLVIGAPFALDGGIGAAYVFTQSAGMWTQTQELTASDAGDTHYFGFAVAVAGDVIVVSAPAGVVGEAYVFQNSSGVWTERQTLEGSDVPDSRAFFGAAVTFDGTTIVIGAPGADVVENADYLPGKAYTYEDTGVDWSETQILVPDRSAPDDQFGYSLALDGTTLLIGAPATDFGANRHQGAAYVFDASGGDWRQAYRFAALDGLPFDQFGQSVALQGGAALIGIYSYDDQAPPFPPARPGAAYLFFETTAGTWTLADELAASDASDNDAFGSSLAIDSGTLLVGAPGKTIAGNVGTGAAYVYTLTDGNDQIFLDGFDGAP